MRVNDYEENYITGYVSLYRSFIKWEWFEVPNMVTVFIYCLLKANFKDKSWRGIEIKRGSFITSLDTMSKDTNLSIQQIRTCLTRLEKTQEINKQSNKQNTLITICKYDSYQSKKETANTQLTNDQQTSNKQLTTTNNVNNINNNNNSIKIDVGEIDFWINEISNSPEYLNSFYRLNNLEKGSASKLLEDFKDHLKMNPVKHPHFSGFKKHFNNWVRKTDKSKYQFRSKGML
jgi:hypothetical protein